MVGGVPGLQVRERAQAVDARVRPEVDEHHLAPQSGERERLRVDPGSVGVERRSRPVVGEGSCRRLPGRQGGPAAADLVELAAGGAAVLDLALQERRVAGRHRRQVVVDVEHEPERDQADERTRGGADRCRMSPQPGRRLAAAACDREHRQRRSHRVGDREEDGAQPDVVVRGDDRDGRQHRPRARHEDEAEGRPEEEAAACPLRPETREGRERPLQQDRRLRHEQRHGQHEQEHDRGVPQEVLRQAQLVQEPRGEQREDAEAGDETGDDAQRLAARGPAREQDRQHGQHARRDGGDDSREQPDAEQDEHDSVVPTGGRLLCYGDLNGF